MGLLVLVACLISTMARLAPARAHARVTGTDPADRSVVDAAPERITVFLAAKPATVEGDPLRVYGPTGERIDDGNVTVSGVGDVVLEGDETALSVGLSPEGARSGGDYYVSYRVISADSHLVAGRSLPACAFATGPTDRLGRHGDDTLSFYRGVPLDYDTM